MRPKPILFLIVFIIMVAGALASGLQIVVPPSPYLESGQGDINLYFQVFNSTNSNISATCTVSIYNSTNAIVLQSSATSYLVMSDNITTNPGVYTYIIQCSSSEYGFTSGTFQIAYGAARDDSIGGNPLAAIILLPVLFGILLMVGAFQLDDEHKVLKVILFLFSYLMVFMSFWFGLQTVVRYYYFTALQDSISTVTWVIGISLFVILSYFLIYAFVMSIHIAAQKKQDKVYGR
jgi:hypothetical protein